MQSRADIPDFARHWQDGRFVGDLEFARMRERFQAAAAARPGDVCESFYRFAGRPVRVRVVGRELNAQILRSFSHLRVASKASRPALRIDLWDASSSPGGASWLPAGRANGWRETTLQTPDERFLAQHLPHTLSCLDVERGELLGCLAWHDDIFIYERAKPFARLLLAWHNAIGAQIVHAGCVARDGAGVLLAGRSGSGKSTSSLLCALAGLDFLGEDYVALEGTGDGSFVAHSLYNSVFLQTQHLEQFPQLATHAFRGRPPHEEKSVVLLADLAPDRLGRSAAIHGLVFPEVGEGDEAQLTPLSKGAALLALAPSSLLQIPNRGLGVRGFERLAELVQAVPCHRLAVGKRWGSIPQRLEELLHGQDRASADPRGQVA